MVVSASSDVKDNAVKIFRHLISPADLNLRVQVQEKGRGKHVVRVKFSPMGEGFRVFFSDLI